MFRSKLTDWERFLPGVLVVLCSREQDRWKNIMLPATPVADTEAQQSWRNHFGKKWKIDCSSPDDFTSDWHTHSPIHLPHFHHRSLLPAEQRTWIIYCWPSGRVCACVSPASDETDHLDHHSKPKPGWPWLLHRPLILTLSVHLFLWAFISQPCLPRFELYGSTSVCVCVCGLPQLGERVHVSGPVKVTPYASCRDNEGFNFTTQAYQIAAPQSLRHATTTWVIWMGRHPPFHVHWAVCTVKFAKRPHHHNHRLFQSGLQDPV